MGSRSVQSVRRSVPGSLRFARERGGYPGDGLAPSRVEGYFVPRLFGEIGMALMVDDLLELCKVIEPALLVFDPYLFAAPLVAAATGPTQSSTP